MEWRLAVLVVIGGAAGGALGRNEYPARSIGNQSRAEEFSRLGPETTDERKNPMGIFTNDIKTMDDLFVHMLRDMYYAENQIVKALPDMIQKATDPALRQAAVATRQY